MHEDQDLRIRAFLVPTLVADRMAGLAKHYKTTSGYVYRAAIRVVAARPPEHPVAYPSVRSADVQVQLVLSAPLS